ncbi:MAG: IS30 family transposase [Gemmiger formicilis]|uniref:IS30 family transposase n=1 Tax=Gemmiger formicilis TaxID=745368 RepID=UPI0039A1AC4A
MGGQHLTWENRIAIESLLKAKVSASQIAAVVGCSKRTVYREIQRGQCEQLNGTTYEMYTIYSAQKAQNRADQMNDLHKGRPVKLCPELAAHLEDYIGTQHYSPAAAVREILLQGLALPQISANTVYRYIYRGYLHLCGLDLPVGRYNVKQKQENSARQKPTGMTAALTNARPRSRPAEDVGFWEMDTVVGTSAGPSRCLLVLTERKTRFEIVRVLESKTAREVLRVLRELRQEFGEDFRKLFKTITCDNGCEFAAAKEMEQFAPIYYCHPYSSWERGTNENQNKPNSPLLQKGKSMACVTADHAEYITLWMNNYPRRLSAGVAPPTS